MKNCNTFLMKFLLMVTAVAVGASDNSSQDALQESAKKGLHIAIRWAIPSVFLTGITYFGIIRPLTQSVHNLKEETVKKFDEIQREVVVFNSEVRRVADAATAIVQEVQETREKVLVPVADETKKTLQEAGSGAVVISKNTTDLLQQIDTARKDIILPLANSLNQTLGQANSTVEKLSITADQSLTQVTTNISLLCKQVQQELVELETLTKGAQETIGIAGVTILNCNQILEPTLETARQCHVITKKVDALLPKADATIVQASNAAAQVAQAAHQAQSSYLFRAVTLGGTSPRITATEQ